MRRRRSPPILGPFFCIATVRVVAVLAVLCLGSTSQAADDAASQPAATDPQAIEFFEKHVRPLLVERCYECHSQQTKNLKGGLLLDSRDGWATGGDTGPAIVPGKPEESLLIRAVQYGDNDVQMPPKGKLLPREIATLVEWVKRGAPDPRTGTAKPTSTIDIERGRQFWAFQPPQASKLPAVQNGAWPQSPIDFFILAALEAKGIQPAPPADKRTLLRRVTFDLTGLPPTPAEMDAFLADESPTAFATVVDRLLASPRYGEAWARHWLDIARYADSNGFDENMAYANAWRYRDYVVDSLNADKPYDRFLTEQLAGDLLPADAGHSAEEAAAKRRERLIATGFLALGAKALAEPDKAKMHMDIVDEQLDTVGRSILGLTLGCARCHDHKFDPLPTLDYYRLAGIFRSTRTMEEGGQGVITPWYENSLLSPVEQQAAAQKSPTQNPATEPPSALGVSEREVADLRVHIRGSHLNQGDLAPRGFPQVFHVSLTPDEAKFDQQQSGRLQLARWLTRPDHPLTGRVLVNRLWRWHFGAGIVRTPDNFGQLGERPTNGPLLDWLAVRLVESGWSLKAMHRLIVLSSTYQMSSQYNSAAFQADPENLLHWRAEVRRLEAGEIRDALLHASGQLDVQMGGTLLKAKNRAFIFDHTSKDETTYDTTRRSLYLPVVRNHLYDTFQLFDFPDPNFLSGHRETTTVAPQALFFMNSDLVMQQTDSLAAALLDDANLNDEGRVTAIYARTLGRSPSAREVQQAQAALSTFEQTLAGREGDAATRRRAWQALCQVIVSSSEFIYLK